MWIALQSWASESGDGSQQRQEVTFFCCQELDQLVDIEQDVKRLLPLVRFSLMNSQFFRRDLSSRFALQMLIQMFRQESCEVRPSAWAGRGGGGGAPFLHRSPCQVRPHSFVEGVTPQVYQVASQRRPCFWGLEPQHFWGDWTLLRHPAVQPSCKVLHN